VKSDGVFIVCCHNSFVFFLLQRMKQAPQDIFFFADFLRIRSQLSRSLSTRPSLLLATGSLRFGRRIPIYILDGGPWFPKRAHIPGGHSFSW